MLLLSLWTFYLIYFTFLFPAGSLGFEKAVFHDENSKCFEGEQSIYHFLSVGP